MKAGARANRSARSLNKFVKTTLDDLGYQPVERRKFDTACYLHQPVYAQHYIVGDSIYNRPLSCQFILYHPEKHPDRLIIECRWQQSRGTTDQKYPYMVLNIKEKFPCPAIIVLDGAGYGSGAAEWLKDQVDGEKLLHVFSMAEFQAWVNDDNL
jgi:hypothetical protein